MGIYLLIYVHKYIIFQLPLKDEKAVSGIESIVFNVVPFCRVITHLKEEVATDRKLEFSSYDDTQYFYNPDKIGFRLIKSNVEN